MATFQPPANLRDFELSSQSQQLFQAWHQFIELVMLSDPNRTPAFFNSIAPPVATPPSVATPQWTGLPRTIKRRRPGSIAGAAKLVEESIAFGGFDPLEEANITEPFQRVSNGRSFIGPRYRPQDEYLEWVTRKDADGVITEILFTCEGPEYWETLAEDRQLLLSLYRELADPSVQLQDLLFPVAVTGNGRSFQAGDYNPYNKWNLAAAIHLTQPANTLGAEINLGRDASRLYGEGTTPLTTDPALIACAVYGDVNRMSDPTIGSAVNGAVRSGRQVSLRDPVGLYMRAIDEGAFSLSDGTPFAEVTDCFTPIRGSGDMVVRARFRVPDGITFAGRQLRVGDLQVNGEQIVAGGQVADVITIHLFALTLPGAPRQRLRACRFRPCPDSNFPEIIQLIPFGQVCPSGGVAAAVSTPASVGSAEGLTAVEEESTAVETVTAALEAVATPLSERLQGYATSRMRDGS